MEEVLTAAAPHCLPAWGSPPCWLTEPLLPPHLTWYQGVVTQHISLPPVGNLVEVQLRWVLWVSWHCGGARGCGATIRGGTSEPAR